MITISKDVVDSIFKTCIPSGMECLNCGKNNVIFSEIEDSKGNTIELHISCTNCQKTLAEFEVVNNNGACGGNCTCDGLNK